MRRLLVFTVAAVAVLAGAPVAVLAQEAGAPVAAAQTSRTPARARQERRMDQSFTI